MTDIDVENLRGGGDPTRPVPPTDPAALARLVPSDRSTGDPGLTGTTPTPPSDRLAERLIRRNVDERLRGRPAWHAVVTPAPVAEAWTAVTAALERVLDVESEAAEVDATHRRREADALAGIRQAAADGTKAPKLPSTDAHRQAVAECEARWDLAVAEARKARGTYDRTVAEHVGAWRDELLARFDATHDDEVNAWRNYRNARASRASLDHALWWVTEQLVGEDFTQPKVRKHQRQVIDEAAAGVEAISRQLGSADPTVNQTWLLEDAQLDPPMHFRREQVEHQGSAAWAWLQKVELAERARGECPSTYTVDEDGNPKRSPFGPPPTLSDDSRNRHVIGSEATSTPGG